MSKTRSDAWLKNLPDDRQEQIIAWCNKQSDRDEENKPIKGTGGYAFARAQMANDGLKVSEHSLSEFYSWWGLKKEFSEADQFTEDIVELIKQIDPNVTAQQLSVAGQVIFTKRALQKRSQEEYVEIEKLRLAKETAAFKGKVEVRKLDQAERRIVLLEENSAKAKEKLETVLKASKGGLTKDTLRQIEEAARLL